MDAKETLNAKLNKVERALDQIRASRFRRLIWMFVDQNKEILAQETMRDIARQLRIQLPNPGSLETHLISHPLRKLEMNLRFLRKMVERR